MRRFLDFIRNNAALSLAISGLFMIITAVSMIHSGRCLKTKNAPGGIVSLELAWNKLDAQQIRDEWRSGYCNGDVISFDVQQNAESSSLIVERAKENILLDFLFLIAYPLFFIVCIILLDVRRERGQLISKASKIVLSLAASSGFLDAVENVFMYQFLEGQSEMNFLFNLPATIKFLFVLVVVGYILVYFFKSLAART
jgi:hypothetical protein